MKLMNALMPGEHNYQKGKPMPGQIQSAALPEIGAAPMAAPAVSKKAGFRRERGPLMNALGGFFEFAAPEAYDAGRQRKFARMESDALGAGKYDEAGRIRMQAGDFEGGQKIADYGQQQQTLARQQEAQKLVTVLSSAAPEQLNQMALSDPAGFEQMAGVSSDEYLQSMTQLMQQGGLSLEDAHRFVLTQAQAEAGLSPQSAEGYTLAPGAARYDAAGNLIANNPVVEKPTQTKYDFQQIGNEMYAVNPLDPSDRKLIGPAPVKSPLVSVSTGDQKGENKFQEGLGTLASSKYGAILEQGQAASASIGNLDTMDALLDEIDYTGFGGDTLLQVQRVGQMFGIEVPDLPAKEAAKRLSSQMALSLKSDLPGPMSNADREFLLSIPPNLNSTQAGNDAIIFILRKREERKQDMMQSLLQANPQSMDEYRAWENRYLQDTPPMFSPATQASLLKALSGSTAE
jgi:hypothetical protein